MRSSQQSPGTQLQAFHRKMPQVFVEARPPRDRDRVAGLQYRPHPRGGPSPHQSEVPAMAARHQLEDGTGLAMAPSAEHDAIIGPFQLECSRLVAIWYSPSEHRGPLAQ